MASKPRTLTLPWTPFAPTTGIAPFFFTPSGARGCLPWGGRQMQEQSKIFAELQRKAVKLLGASHSAAAGKAALLGLRCSLGFLGVHVRWRDSLLSSEDELCLRTLPLLQGWSLPQVGSPVSNSGCAFLGGVIALRLCLLSQPPVFMESAWIWESCELVRCGRRWPPTRRVIGKGDDLKPHFLWTVWKCRKKVGSSGEAAGTEEWSCRYVC